MSTAGVTALAQAAARGDQAAWDALVARYGNLVWSVARAHRLSPDEAADVSQLTWLRLVEHIDRIHNLEGIGSWLATTARNECLRTIRRSGRQVPAGDAMDLAIDTTVPAATDRLLEVERDAALWQAFALLSERCQRLLRILMADPPPSYDDVSEALDMPIGSIGPTRGRCLTNLRTQAERAGITID